MKLAMSYFSKSRIKKITWPLKIEVDNHNSIIFDLCYETKKKYGNENNLTDLSKMRIQTGNEMEGEGLRRTYVELGSEWVDKKWRDNWLEAQQNEQQERRSYQLRKYAYAILKPVACCMVICLAILSLYGVYKANKAYTHKIYLPKLAKGKKYQNVQNFVTAVFNKFILDGATGLDDEWDERLDSEDRYYYTEVLNDFKDLRFATIEQIYTDTGKKNNYHILCTDPMNDSIVTILCKRRENKLKLIGIE